MRFFKYSFFFVLFFLVILQTSSAMGQFFFFQHPLQDKKAPDFILKTTQGQEKRMTEFLNGQSGIVFFWSTWCPHCRTQLSYLYKNRQRLEKQGIKLVLVDIEETARDVKDYLKRRKINFEVFLDQEAQVADQYSIIGIPAFFFVDPQGQVVAAKNFFPKDYMRFFRKQNNGSGFSDSPRKRIDGID